MTRLALIGPYPPERNGIADYNERVVEAMPPHVAITVFDPTLDPRSPRPGRGAVPVLPIGALGRVVDPDEFDVVVYTFGNSEHHHASYELLQRLPGVAWLHDVRMTGLHFSYSWQRRQEERLVLDRAVLERQYGRPLPADIREPATWNVDHFEQVDRFMAWELARFATQVCVNSRHAYELLIRDLSHLTLGRPPEVLPFAVPEGIQPSEGARRWIVAPGFVTPVKLPDLLVEAYALSASRGNTGLVFVGAVDDELRATLSALAARLGVADDVTFTGYASSQVYADYLTGAACTALLRRTTQGESSAAVADCLAHAVPTVTNIPSTRDFGTQLLHHVDGIPSAQELAAALDRAVAVPSHERQLDDGFRAAHSFSAVARALLVAAGQPVDADAECPTGLACG